ncbi:MAG TPA: condensation domain-containing protein, partial [Thermoanaerobaculia bacterium]
SAAVNVLLHRYTGREDLLLNSTFAARTRPELGGLIGLFINTAVLRTDLSGAPRFRALLHRVRDAVLAAYSHLDVPFPRLIAELYPGETLSRTFFSRVNFNVLSFAGGAMPANEDLAIESYTVINPPAKYDLALTWREGPDFLLCGLSSPRDLMTQEAIGRLREDLDAVLQAAVAAPDAPIADLLPEPRHRPYRAPAS